MARVLETLYFISWCADGTEKITPMEEHHSLADPIEEQKTNGHANGSLHPGHHHTLDGNDHSPERAPLDESFLPKNLVLAKEDMVIRKHSASVGAVPIRILLAFTQRTRTTRIIIEATTWLNIRTIPASTRS